MSYLCPTHGTEQTDFCEACISAFPDRRNADDMTGDERVEEMERIAGVVSMPFDTLHQRITELVGRPVWTHEMAGREWWELLLEEARTRQHPSFGEVLNKIPGDKPIIPILLD